MKKILLILGLTFLGLTSCKKEVITPKNVIGAGDIVELVGTSTIGDTAAYYQFVFNYMTNSGEDRTESFYTYDDFPSYSVDSVDWSKPFCGQIYASKQIAPNVYDVIAVDGMVLKNDTIIDQKFNDQNYYYCK